MSIGGNPAVPGDIALGDTVDQVIYVDGNTSNDCDSVVLGGVTIWERDYDLSATAVYDPITKEVTYAVTMGQSLTSWSYQAIRQGDNADTGEIFVTNGDLSIDSGVLGVPQDGTWDVTFKGFKDGVAKANTQVTVTVATPFVEITSVVELTPATPTIAIGDVVGLMAYGSETETVSQDTDEAEFRYVVLDGIFDSVTLPLDPSAEGQQNERTGKTFQELIDDDDYPVWTPGTTGNKEPLDGIIASIPTTSTGHAWHIGDAKEGTTMGFNQTSNWAGGTAHAGVGLRFRATIGDTTYTLGITSSAVFSGPGGGNAMPYFRNTAPASFWTTGGPGVAITRNIQSYYVHEIEAISV